MNTTDLKALEKRIQRLERLEDIEAIKNLKAQYASICDDKYNPQKIVKLFTEDAIWNGGKELGIHKGRAAIKKFFEGVSQTFVFGVHYFVQPIIKINKDGETATGKWYLWQASTLKGGIAVWAAALEYDKYKKVNGNWLMSEMKLKIFFLTPFEQGWHKIKILK